MWRHYAIAVEKGGVTQYSNDNPKGEAVFFTAFLLFLTAVGLFAAYAGGHAVARAPDYARTGLPARLGQRWIQAVVAMLCAIPAGLFGTLTGPIGTIVLWAALVGVILVTTRRRGTPTSHQPPGP